MDVPYEHNAGTPYIWASHRDVESYELMKVAYEGPFVTPDAYHTNSPYSVEMINAGAVAWLRTEQWAKERVVIPAGTSLSEFIRKVYTAGGAVYKEVRED